MKQSIDLQRKAAARGFKWPSINHAIGKIHEELVEVQACVPGTERFSEELGDLLFACIGLAVFAGVNPYNALQTTNEKFQARFDWVAKKLGGVRLDAAADFATIYSLWDQAKSVAPTEQNPTSAAQVSSIRAAVVGRWDETDRVVLDHAFSLGQQLAKAGATLFTGGGPGVMNAACAGARSEGGLTVGLLGTADIETEANRHLDVAIPTALGWDVRSALLIRCVNVVILIGGGNGSLQELTMAYMAGKPIIVLKGSGGWADRLKCTLYDGHYLDERENVRIQYADSVSDACSKALASWSELQNTTKKAR